MRAPAAIVVLASASTFVAACNLLVGAPLPDVGGGADATADAGATESGSPEGGRSDATVPVGGDARAPDATSPLEAAAPRDGGTDSGAPRDGGVDTPEAGDDGGDDGGTSCIDLCTPGTTRCVDGGVTTCTVTRGSCAQWTEPAGCPGSETCATSDVSAFCCNACCGAGSSCRATSCAGTGGDGLDNCGPASAESCCSSALVPGGPFVRADDGAPGIGFPATVSSFALDRFEVTVGRFRRFVDAWDGGWRPQPGAGIHRELNGGRGLVDSRDAGVFEPGWDPAWNAAVPADAGAWSSAMACGSPSTWTAPSPATAPINCVTWFEAYAFCIWDGGFLPSEAEWSYATLGGGDVAGQRVYPWSAPSTSNDIDCTYANYGGCGIGVAPVGLLSPAGDGRWGQADLLGNVWEWTFDSLADYSVPCADCADTREEDAGRTIHGGDLTTPLDELRASNRQANAPTIRYKDDGFRCARAP